MKVLMLITSSQVGRPAWYAYELAKALAVHHQVDVFFYGEAVSLGNRNIWLSADLLNLHKAWCQLNVTRWVCTAAALSQGVVDAENAEQYQLADASLDSAFKAVGLGEFARLLESADRVIQF